MKAAEPVAHLCKQMYLSIYVYLFFPYYQLSEEFQAAKCLLRFSRCLQFILQLDLGFWFGSISSEI